VGRDTREPSTEGLTPCLLEEFNRYVIRYRRLRRLVRVGDSDLAVWVDPAMGGMAVAFHSHVVWSIYRWPPGFRVRLSDSYRSLGSAAEHVRVVGGAVGIVIAKPPTNGIEVEWPDGRRGQYQADWLALDEEWLSEGEQLQGLPDLE